MTKQQFKKAAAKRPEIKEWFIDEGSDEKDFVLNIIVTDDYIIWDDGAQIARLHYYHNEHTVSQFWTEGIEMLETIKKATN